MRRHLVIGLILVLAAAWAWIALRPGPEERLAELVAELRARGEPVTLAETEPHLPPDEENGALDLDAAWAWWDAHEPEDYWEARVAGPWNPTGMAPWEENSTPEQLAALDEFLVFTAPLHEMVDRGAEKAEIAWPLPDLDEDAFALGVRAPLLQELNRHLSARALKGAGADDRLRALRTKLRIATRLRARTMIGHLVASTVFAQGCRELRTNLLMRSVDPAAARAQLDAALAHGWDATFRPMVRRERAFLLERLPYWMDGSAQEAWYESIGGTPPGLGDALRRLLRGTNPFDDGDAFDADETIREIREMERWLDPALDARALHDATPGSVTTQSSIAAVLGRIRVKLVQSDMLARLARVALAAYEHRRAHGDWPATAADLAPLFPDGVPRDPYTDEPFALERDADALVIRARPWPDLIENLDDPLEHGHVWRLAP